MAKGEKERLIPSELTGVGVLVAALLLLLGLISFHIEQEASNWLGLIGHLIAFGLLWTFGLGSFLLFGYLTLWGWRLLVGRLPRNGRLEIACFGIFLLSTSTLLNIAAFQWSVLGAWFAPSHLGGFPLYYLFAKLPYANLRYLLSTLGTTLICFTLSLSALLVMSDVKLSVWLKRIKTLKKGLQRSKKSKPEVKLLTPTPRASPFKKPTLATPPPSPPSGGASIYALPTESLLSKHSSVDNSALKKALQQQAQTLEATLANFQIEAKVGEINCGPTIASFEVIPSVGVKVQRIKALENDIALNLQARSIRIIAPIPGKAAVGIEIPSPHPHGVGFHEMLDAYAKLNKKCAIPLLLGKSVTGEPVIADLAKMPHMIIAGATGSGKSVCINSIIISLLVDKRPDQVRLLMIDPKKVELTAYSRLPHMLAPVITEPIEACSALNWLVREMEKRYDLLKRLSLRNINAFNGRKRNLVEEENLGVEVPETLPYLVAIVDELADLMMTASSDIETPITRIAQMARAVGIHLILATQRPSKEVITGIIKANFPAKIAFKVASGINSRIIIDENGAEALLGNGDMLFLNPEAPQLIRAQGTYVSDDEINKVIDHISAQAPPNYQIESFHAYGSTDGGASTEELDSLYSQACELVRSTGVASTTFIQRKLKVGYARAASIMDQLEGNGVIGPQEGAKPRQVFPA
ncbi:MAG: DNA translocase FtsK 4TM domain-containing protein [Verrucomicrobia bacterium]|nr:DNA translocase FtsK 4TM domain-containing protein [Verrucomicrobiota bacterium]